MRQPKAMYESHNSRDYTLAGTCDGDTNGIVHILHLPITSDSQGYDGTYHLTSAGRLSDPEKDCATLLRMNDKIMAQLN